MAQKGGALCGEVSSGLGARAGVARRPKLSGQGGMLIDRSLNSTIGPALSPHGLLQALNRLRGKVTLTRLNFDPSRHVFEEQKLPVDLDVVGRRLDVIDEVTD